MKISRMNKYDNESKTKALLIEWPRMTNKILLVFSMIQPRIRPKTKVAGNCQGFKWKRANSKAEKNTATKPL